MLHIQQKHISTVFNGIYGCNGTPTESNRINVIGRYIANLLHHAKSAIGQIQDKGTGRGDLTPAICVYVLNRKGLFPLSARISKYFFYILGCL